MVMTWLIILIIFVMIEGLTVGLTSIWFALGALAALIAAALFAPLWLQITLFIVVSIIALVITRPLAKKYLNPTRKATNADRLLGTTCTVTERIDNLAGTGAVSSGGKRWTARTLTGETMEVGELGEVDHIDGVKLIIVPVRFDEAPEEEPYGEESEDEEYVEYED